MRRLMAGGWTQAPELSPELARVGDWKFTRVEDCIVFSEQHRGSKRNDFPDSTGFESYVNHIHIDDFVSERRPMNLVEKAIALAAHLNHRLHVFAPDTGFRFIIAATEDGCTLRFHVARNGEQWETRDLELYTEEAVAVIDSGELNTFPKVPRSRRS